MMNRKAVGYIQLLTEDELLTLGMLLRERIEETTIIAKSIREEITKESSLAKKEVMRNALALVLEVQADCYSIAIKMKVEYV